MLIHLISVGQPAWNKIDRSWKRNRERYSPEFNILPSLTDIITRQKYQWGYISEQYNQELWPNLALIEYYTQQKLNTNSSYVCPQDRLYNGPSKKSHNKS